MVNILRNFNFTTHVKGVTYTWCEALYYHVFAIYVNSFK